MSNKTRVCPSCQSHNKTTDAFCFHCGIDLRKLPIARNQGRQRFNWGWVARAALIIVATSFAAGFLTRASGLVRHPTETVIIAIGVTGLFLGGLISGYKSPGVTLKEPAVAAALVTVFLALVNQNLSASVRYQNAILGWILPFMLAYMGAWLGEKLQRTL